MEEDEEVIDVPLIIPKRKTNGSDIPLIIPSKKKENTPQVSTQDSKTIVSPLKNGSTSSQDGNFSPVDQLLGQGKVEDKAQNNMLPVMGENKPQEATKDYGGGLETATGEIVKPQPVSGVVSEKIVLPVKKSGEQKVNVPAEQQLETEQFNTNYAQLARDFPVLQEKQTLYNNYLEATKNGIAKERPNIGTQEGQIIAQALDLPKFVGGNVQGILDGLDKIKQSAALVEQSNNTMPTLLSKDFYTGLTGMLLGSAEVGIGTAMNSPAGYLFTQGINADQVYSGGVAGKIIMAPVTSALEPLGLLPEGELGQNVLGIADLTGSLLGLGVAHAALEGGAKGALTEAKAKYDKGEDLTGNEIKLLTETVHQEASNPQSLQKIHDAAQSLPKDTKPSEVPKLTEQLAAIPTETLNKIPTELAPEKKVAIAPIVEKRETLTAENEQLKKDNEKIIEPLQKVNKDKIAANDKEIKNIDGEIVAILDGKDKSEPIDLPVKEEVAKPTDEQILQDLKDKNFSTFTYEKESDIPEVFKDKISSKGETNGKKFFNVTLPKSEADFLLKSEEQKNTPKEEPKVVPKESKPKEEVKSSQPKTEEVVDAGDVDENIKRIRSEATAGLFDSGLNADEAKQFIEDLRNGKIKEGSFGSDAASSKMFLNTIHYFKEKSNAEIADAFEFANNNRSEAKVQTPLEMAQADHDAEVEYIQTLKDRRDGEDIKYKNQKVTTSDGTITTKKVLKTPEELQSSKDKINDAIEKAEVKLEHHKKAIADLGGKSEPTKPTTKASNSDSLKPSGEIKAEEEVAPEIKKVKSFKTDEGNFSVYDIEKDVRGRGDMFTVHEDKDGWIVRNALVPDNLQKKGIATEFYKRMNEESIKATGKPLRSTQPRTLVTGEVVHELSEPAIKLWDGLVKKGLAEKLGEKDYKFKNQKSTPKEEVVTPLKDVESTTKALEDLPSVRENEGEVVLPDNVQKKIEDQLNADQVAKYLDKASDEKIKKQLNDFDSNEREIVFDTGIESFGYDIWFSISKGKKKGTYHVADEYPHTSGFNQQKKSVSNVDADGVVKFIQDRMKDHAQTGSWIMNPKAVAEAYHKAKSDGSNPELVKAVEESLKTEASPKESESLSAQISELELQREKEIAKQQKLSTSDDDMVARSKKVHAEYDAKVEALKAEQKTEEIISPKIETNDNKKEGTDSTTQEAKTEEVVPSEKGGEDVVAPISEKKLTEKLEPKVTETKTNTERAKKLADKIRTFKTKPLELKDENGNPIKLTKKGFDENDLIEAIAKAVEETGKVADSIVAELKKHDWYNNLTDKGKKAVEDQLGEHFSGEIGERQFTKRLLESDEVHPESKEELAKNLEYIRRKNDFTVEEARSIIEKVGDEEAFNLVTADGEVHPATRVVMGSVLIKKFSEQAAKATDQATKDYYLDKAIDTANYVTEKLGTETGRTIQAFSLWSRLSPEGQLRDAQRQQQKIAKDKINKRKADIGKISDRFQDANKEAVEEVLGSKKITDAVEDAKKKSGEKTKEKLTKIKEKRKQIYDKYKKGGRNLLSANGLSKEGIEFAGEMALTYIEEGVVRLSDLVDKVLIELKTATGAEDFTSEAKLKVQYAVQDALGKTGERLAKGGIEQMEIDLNDIVRQHYTVAERTKTDLAAKIVANTSLDGMEAQALATHIQKAFDIAATKKKQQILSANKRRFDRIQEKLKSGKKVEPKALQDEIIEYSNLGAFTSEQMSEVIAKKLGIDKLTTVQANEIIRLADVVQKAPEGSPKREATEDLLAYKAKIAGTSVGEVAQAAWYSSVLSGYMTHAKNIISTFFNGTMFAGAEMLRDPRSIPYLLSGATKGTLRRGLPEALNTLTTGRSPIHISKVETPQVLERINFKGGLLNPANYLKFVTRAMVAEDVLGFQGLKEMKATQLALSQAKKEGLNPLSRAAWHRVNELLLNTHDRYEVAELQTKTEGLTGIKAKRRIWELMENNRPQSMVDESYGFAAKGTFNHETEGSLGALTDAFAKALDVEVKGTRPLRFVVPFTRIVTNVVNNSLDFSPIGLVRAARGVRGFEGMKDKYHVLTPEEKAQLVSRASLGIALTAGLVGMQQAGLIDITGGGTGDYRKDAQLRQSGWQPYSIKVGDKYFSYQFTPLVFNLGLAGLYLDHNRFDKDASEETALKKMEIAAWQTSKLMADMTWIGTTSTLMGAMSETNPDVMSGNIEKVLGNSAKSFVLPNAYTQSARLYESLAGLSQKQTDGLYDRMLQDIPIARNELNNKLNALGDDIPVDASIFTSTTIKDKYWDYLNGKKVWIAPPNQGTVIVFDNNTKQDRPITNDEYHDFIKKRGAKLKQEIDGILNNGADVKDANDNTVHKTAFDLTKTQLQKIMTSKSAEATKETKEEMFGEKEQSHSSTTKKSTTKQGKKLK